MRWRYILGCIIFKRILVYLLLFVLALFMLVIVAGIYKFNFTDDDIYVDMNGTVVPYDTYKKKQLENH